MEQTEFFSGYEKSREIFDHLYQRIRQRVDFDLRITKSQITFVSGKPCAWVWIPARYLKGPDLAPLVLTLVLPYQHPSPRWKEIVEPRPGSFTHHLELYSIEDIDQEVEDWLTQVLTGNT